MIAQVARWGKGSALRLRRKDLERAGVSDGDFVEVEIVRVAKKRWSLVDLPIFEDADPKASVRHDEYLYE